MATVSVTADNTRVEDSEATTGWSNRGGGAGVAAEAPLAYQGTNTVNRKITSSTGAGFEYDPVVDGGSAQDMTAAATAHWMVKHIVSDAGGLRANDGVRVIIGDGSNEYAFITAGSDAVKTAYQEYLLRTATIIIPVNPNIAGYRDGVHSGGTVTLTAVDIFGIDAEFANATAKSENVGLDAIDLGQGLVLVGGDGADPDGVWGDFVAEDEGVVNNRWGYASSFQGAVNLFFGRMRIGSATATVFADEGALNLWPDGLYAAGFSHVFADLQNAGTAITDGSTHTSLGTTAVEDTRADFTWSGTAGTGSASHVLNNFRNYTMTSAVTLDGASIEIVDLTQASGTIQNSTIRCNAVSGGSVCDDPTFVNLDNVTFAQAGAGHALLIGTPGVYAFTNLFFNGFGADETNSAAVFNNSGGAVTINVSGGDSPTVRNGISATTTVNNTITWTITGMQVGDELTVVRISDDAELFHVESSATGTEQYAFDGIDAGTAVRVLVLNVADFEPFAASESLPSSSVTFTVNQTEERVYDNP